MIKTSKCCAGLFLLCILVCLLAAQPATARGSAINQIESDDVIFVYEEDLDLTSLRANVTLPVTALIHYVGDNPEMPEINRISVQDDTSFSVYDSYVGNEYGTYYAWSSLGVAGPAIRISEPEIEIEAVLPAPNHSDRISGTEIPTGTEIAFRVTSHDVGKYYTTNGNDQAVITISMTPPSGASRTVIVQRISDSELYTDDSWGAAGSQELDDGEGTYTFQAHWSSPQGFADYASDSNVISVMGIKEVEEEATPTDTFTWPVHTDTPETYETPTSTITWPIPTDTPYKPAVVTAAPTPVPTTLKTSKTPNIPTVVRTEATTTPDPGDLIPSFGSLAVATTEPTPTPVPEPADLIPVFGGLAAALLIMRRR